MHFFAATTVPGGVFSEFEVEAAGEKPEIDANEGGDHASLDLTATPRTGAILLRAHYTKDGKQYDAEPVTVNFCAINPIELADGEHDLAFAGESLKVAGKTTALFNGREADSDIAWEIEGMGSPTVLTPTPGSARGPSIAFEYRGLPLKNSDFGPKMIWAGVKKGQCACLQSEKVRTFFPIDGTDHPGGGGEPNWMFYWRQTGAMAPDAKSSSSG